MNNTRFKIPNFRFAEITTMLILAIQFCIPLLLFAQPHSTKSEDEQLFKKLLTKPETYTPTQRVEIYNQHIGSYFRTNTDSVQILYQQMYDFGVKIKDEYVMGSAMNASAELSRMRGNYLQAIPYYREALTHINKYPHNKYEVLGSLGSVYMLVDELDSAEVYMGQSLALVLAIKDTSGYAAAYLQHGVLLAHQEKYYAALQQFFLALDFADFASIELRKANTYSLIADCYQAVRDYESAIVYSKRALAIAQEKKYIGMEGEMNEKLGVSYLQLNSFDLAESYFLAAVSNAEANETPKSLIANYSNLAILASRRNDIPLAEKYLNTAMSYVNADISDLHKAVYYQAKGSVSLHKKNWTESIRSYQKVVHIGKETGTEQNRLNGYAGLAEAYRRSDQYKTALVYGDSLSHLQQVLDLAFQNKTMVDLTQKYEANIKNEEIAKLNAMQTVQSLELSQRHKQLMFSLIGLFLAIAAVGAFGYALITKSRNHKILFAKNTQLSEALDNNKMLIKEIHHRVKNNLQVVSSLLNLQSRFETDSTVLRAINTGKYRVQSMSLLHQNLYLNEDLHSIKVKKYFEDLAQSLVKGYPLNGKEVKLELDIEDITLDIDTVVPMGLICNELITNALKYAYGKSTHCRLWVSVKEANGKIRLIVKDDGIGTSFTQLPEKSTSMGTQLIKSFANKLKASIEIDNFEGTEFKLTFERKAQIHSFNMLKNVAG